MLTVQLLKLCCVKKIITLRNTAFFRENMKIVDKKIRTIHFFQLIFTYLQKYFNCKHIVTSLCMMHRTIIMRRFRNSFRDTNGIVINRIAATSYQLPSFLIFFLFVYKKLFQISSATCACEQAHHTFAMCALPCVNTGKI